MHRPLAFRLRRTFQVVLLGSALLAAAPAVAAVRVGDAAPSCTLTDASGRSVELASFRGRVVILDFTASWCVACRTALPALEALGRRYADRGVAVVTVVIDAARADADRFLATVVPGHTMTVLYDPAAQALARFGAAGMPAHYVLDPRGVVRMVASGYADDRIAALEATVTRLLAEPERSVSAAP
jgi:thiol-disulfide isomerase/thioredoxin